MRFGLCTSLEEAPRAVDAGFDYVEVAAIEFLGREEVCDLTRFSGLPVETTNVFLPGEIRLFGRDRVPYADYVKRTLERAQLVGVQLMVIGSGESRRMPEDDPRYPDRDKLFSEFVVEVAVMAEQAGITIAPESLNRSETNVANDLAVLANLLKGSAAGYTVDTYHVLYELEAEGNALPPTGNDWARNIPYLPAHVHLSDRNRLAPNPMDPHLVGCVHRLSQLGYTGRVSLECKRTTDRSLSQMLADAKALFAL